MGYFSAKRAEAKQERILQQERDRGFAILRVIVKRRERKKVVRA